MPVVTNADEDESDAPSQKDLDSFGDGSSDVSTEGEETVDEVAGGEPDLADAFDPVDEPADDGESLQHPLDAIDPLEELDPRNRARGGGFAERSDFISIRRDSNSARLSIKPVAEKAGIEAGDYIDMDIDIPPGPLFEGDRPFITLIRLEEDEEPGHFSRKVTGGDSQMQVSLPKELLTDPQMGLGIDYDTYSNEDKLLLYPKVLEDGLVALYVAYPESIYESLDALLSSPLADDIDALVERMGVGYFTAGQLVDQFGSLDALVNTTEAELASEAGLNRDFIRELKAEFEDRLTDSEEDDSSHDRDIQEAGESADAGDEIAADTADEVIPMEAIEQTAVLYGVDVSALEEAVATVATIDRDDVTEAATASVSDGSRTAYMIDTGDWTEMIGELVPDDNVRTALQVVHEDVAKDVLSAADADVDYQLEYAGKAYPLVLD